MRTRHLLLISASVFMFACGEDEESKPKTVEDPNTVSQGKTVGQQSTALTVLPAGADQAAGEAAFNQVGNSMQAFVNQYRTYKAQEQSGNNPGTAGIPGQLRQAQEAEGEDQFTFADGRMQANITYVTPQASINYVVDLTLGSGEGGQTIDGTFDFSYVGSAAGYDIEYVYDASYDNLTISGGCATAGSFTINYNFKISGDMIDNLPAEARQQIEDGVGGSGTLTATFGPTCEDVVVAGT